MIGRRTDPSPSPARVPRSAALPQARKAIRELAAAGARAARGAVSACNIAWSQTGGVPLETHAGHRLPLADAVSHKTRAPRARRKRKRGAPPPPPPSAIAPWLSGDALARPMPTGPGDAVMAQADAVIRVYWGNWMSGY